MFASADEVYDLETGSLRYSVHSQHPVRAVAFGHAGAYLALAAGESVRVVNTLDGVQFAEVHHAKRNTGIAFSPDGEQLATSGNDNTARIWHLSRYAGEGPTEEIARLSPGSTPSFVAFSADGGTWRRVRKTASPACGKSATLVSSSEPFTAASMNPSRRFALAGAFWRLPTGPRCKCGTCPAGAGRDTCRPTIHRIHLPVLDCSMWALRALLLGDCRSAAEPRCARGAAGYVEDGSLVGHVS